MPPSRQVQFSFFNLSVLIFIFSAAVTPDQVKRTFQLLRHELPDIQLFILPPCILIIDRFVRRLFKAVSGLPPQQFLIQCRLQQAASLLVGTGETVGVIAERVGIGNEFYFSRLFKAKYRIPPLEYRREFAGRY